MWGLGEGDGEVLEVPTQGAVWNKTSMENILGLVVEESITPYIYKRCYDNRKGAALEKMRFF